MFHVPEKYRIERTVNLNFGSSRADGNNGVFMWRDGDLMLRTIASDGSGWEHVSVSVHRKYRGKVTSLMPSWSQMCEVKDLFWDPEDVVIQIHPKHSEYVNNVSYVLHLWRPIGQIIPTPPAILVGFKDLGTLA